MLSAIRHAVLTTVTALLPGMESGTCKKSKSSKVWKSLMEAHVV